MTGLKHGRMEPVASHGVMTLGMSQGVPFDDVS